MKKELKSRIEFALMGMVVKVQNDELYDVVKYITSAVNSDETPEDIINKMFQYCSEGYEVKHMVCNTLDDMVVFTVTIKSKDDETYDVLDEYGVFSSVYNFTYPDCSELGYTFFKLDKNNILRRIG